MKRLFEKLWNDEEGAEIAEWVVVVALLVGVGVVIYTEVLQPELSSAVETIGGAINDLGT